MKINQQAMFHTLLGHIYDSITAPSGFQRFVDAFVGAAGLKAAMMFSRKLDTEETTGIWVSEVDHRWLESYGLKYGADDMLAHHIARSPLAHFYASNIDLDPDVFAQSRFYKEWVVPQGGAYAAGAIVFKEGAWLTQIVLQRGPAQAPFSHDELALFNLLMPHLQRAVQLRQRFTDLSLHERFFTGGLDRMTLPAVVVNEFGRVSYSNPMALRMLSQNQALRLDDGYLSSSSLGITKQIHLEIVKAINLSRGAVAEACGIVRIARSDRRPLILLVSPLSMAAEGGGQVAALVFMYDQELARGLTRPMVRTLFGLTGAEADLAIALCAGKTVDDAAGERGTSIHTVRTQLKSIFQKTGTNRQTDLVSMLLASPAYVMSGDARPTPLPGLAR